MKNNNALEEVEIKRGRVGSISLFEITDAELQIIEHGSPSSLLVNIAFFAASAFLSFLIVLLTTKIESDRIFVVFVLVTIVSCVTTVICSLVAYRMRGGVGDVIKKIKARVPGAEVEKQDEPLFVAGPVDPESQDP